MPQPSSDHGHFYWNELLTRDPDKAKAFYGGVIGWTFEPMAMPEGTYWVAKMGDAIVGGLFLLTSPNTKGCPSPGSPI
jgi:predicted enzyme related to lactoylglutathione lyase